MKDFLAMGSKIISSLILMSVMIYSWHILLKRKINFKSPKIYIVLAILSLVSICNYYVVNQYIRIFSVAVLLIISFYVLFKEKINVTVITPIYTQLIFMISETIFIIIITLIFQSNTEDLLKFQAASFLTNIAVTLLSFCIIQLKFVRNIYTKLLKFTDKLNRHSIIIVSMIAILIANVLAMILYYKVEFVYMLLFNVALTLFCFTMVLLSFRSQNNYIKVYDKYNTTLNSLKEYEAMLDKYRVLGHENKNQLLTIRNMLPKSNKNVISYIDNLVENNLKDNDKAMRESLKIPAGGLRELVYTKILYMKNKKISYDLIISPEIYASDLIKIDDSTMLDICKILGVYIDNAIQEVENLPKKYVAIEMYLDKKCLVITVANNYSGIINVDKIEKSGYTSKGESHGYGLTLAKKIIDSNKRLSNTKEISNEIFKQKLKIKM